LLTPNDNVQTLLQALSQEDQARLTHFAAKRLCHFGVRTHDAEDLFQQAMYAILSGGRQPAPRDLATQEAFKNYIRGVINSVSEGWSRAQHRTHHCSLDLIGDTLESPTENHGLKDIKIQIFARMRQLAPERLSPTIDAWEQSPDGRVPVITSRKHSAAVNALARQAAKEILTQEERELRGKRIAVEEAPPGDVVGKSRGTSRRVVRPSSHRSAREAQESPAAPSLHPADSDS
jgi:DNA-directed RNA polymerase specialized sigma24 family protein